MRASVVHDVDAERSVIGAVLIDPEAAHVVIDLLAAEDFALPRHSQIFAAMVALHGRGEPIDDVTVAAELARRCPGARGLATVVAQMSATVASAVNAGHWARIVREQAVARRIATAADAAKRAALSSDIEGSVAKVAEIEDIASHRHDGGEAWAEQQHGPAWPRLGEAAFYGLAGAYVRAVEPYTEADPVAVLVQLLVAFGNMIGRGPHFRAEADRHHTNEFVVLVGNSAKGRKGASWGHVRRLCERVDPEWMASRVRTGLASGEGLVHVVRDPASSEEAPQDGRLLVLESEFASALAVAAREGNTISAVVRNAWDGVALGNLTKHNPDRASGAHVSVIGHITEDELHRRLSAVDIGNGFANRFLWICVRRSKCLPEGARVADEVFSPFAERLSAAVELAKKVGEMRRDDDARRLWHEAYPVLSASRMGLLDALTCRAEPHVMRLSCLYALLDHSDVIRAPHLRAALALWRFVEASCLHIFGAKSGDPVADAILEALREKPEGMSRTEISAVFARNKRSSEITRALSALARRGLATSARIKTAGAPKEIWRPVLAGEVGVEPSAVSASAPPPHPVVRRACRSVDAGAVPGPVAPEAASTIPARANGVKTHGEDGIHATH